MGAQQQAIASASSPTPPMTAEEFLHFSAPSHPKTELVQGALVFREAASLDHGTTNVQLIVRLHTFVEEHQLGYVFTPDTGFIVATAPDTVRLPDVSFVRASRLPFGPRRPKFFHGAPDLAVEVTSPSNRAGQISAKLDEYFRAGAQIVWIIDSAKRAVTVYRADGTTSVRTEEDVLDGEAVIPGFRCGVRELFR
jgi:Uma2 family endonuclease